MSASLATATESAARTGSAAASLARLGRAVSAHARRSVIVTAVLSPVVLTSAWLIADAVQPRSYSPMRETVSVLAGYAGTDRWIMTSALLIVGLCYLATALGMNGISIQARVGLLVAGACGIGIAVFPQPADGSRPQHMAFTAIGEAALAVWPAIVGLADPARISSASGRRWPSRRCRWRCSAGCWSSFGAAPTWAWPSG
jgi:hypothetical protein